MGTKILRQYLIVFDPGPWRINEDKILASLEHQYKTLLNVFLKYEIHICKSRFLTAFLSCGIDILSEVLTNQM